MEMEEMFWVKVYNFSLLIKGIFFFLKNYRNRFFEPPCHLSASAPFFLVVCFIFFELWILCKR